MKAASRLIASPTLPSGASPCVRRSPFPVDTAGTRAKLGSANDPLEGEAYRVADGVASFPSDGDALTAEQRAYFEPRFGRNFSTVRIHTDAATAAAADRIGARAYALGSDIGFADGEYAPGTAAGKRLVAHELAHVAQGGGGIRRAPKGDAPKEEKPSDEIKFTAKDLLAYPLFVDLWNDIFAQKLTDKQKNEFKLKGNEGAAIWNLIFAGGPAGASLGANASFGDFLEAWMKHAKEIHRISGSDSFYLDLFGRFVGLNLDSYLGSDLFKSRLKTHAASLVSIYALAQTIFSTVQAVKEPAAKPGELEPTQVEKQTLLLATIFNLVLAEQIKAPDFFTIGPLKLATHPAYAEVAATAGGGPPELTFEHRKGEGQGQGGERLKLGLTLNLPQIVGLFQKDAPAAKELADLQKNRGWQGSLWFSYDKSDPTALQRQAGRLPSESFHLGTLFGGGGFLGELEGGGRYTGDAAQGMTGWFLRGGFGYSGRKHEVIQKMGFAAVYTDWTEQDILAPRRGAGGAPLAGQAFQFTPFTRLEFGERHRFGVGAALGFVTGTHEGFGVSDVRGDLSYTYLGDRSEEQLPVFKLELSASRSRLDWWNPDSPLIAGVQARASFNQYFLAGQLNTGADKIPDTRAAQIGEKPDTIKVKVPTAVLFSAGVQF